MESTVAGTLLPAKSGTAALTGSVRHGALAALRGDGNSKSSKSVITYSYLHPECFVFENRKCDGSRTLRGCRNVLYGAKQMRKFVFQK